MFNSVNKSALLMYPTALHSSPPRFMSHIKSYESYRLPTGFGKRKKKKKKSLVSREEKRNSVMTYGWCIEENTKKPLIYTRRADRCVAGKGGPSRCFSNGPIMTEWDSRCNEALRHLRTELSSNHSRDYFSRNQLSRR